MFRASRNFGNYCGWLYYSFIAHPVRNLLPTKNLVWN